MRVMDSFIAVATLVLFAYMFGLAIKSFMKED